MSTFIGIAGNIGVGKTTFTQMIADRFGLDPYFESVIDNPYLSEFYGDMERWSFHLQIFFLHHRFKTHVAMSANARGSVQDRTIYEDVEIFAHNLHEMGNMSNRDHANYTDLFDAMTSYLQKPDLIIYLQASTDTLLSRIRGRDRDFERSIDPEYLYRLNISYESWINRIKETENVLIIDTNKLNVFEDKDEVTDLLNHIGERLSIVAAPNRDA